MLKSPLSADTPRAPRASYFEAIALVSSSTCLRCLRTLSFASTTNYPSTFMLDGRLHRLLLAAASFTPWRTTATITAPATVVSNIRGFESLEGDGLGTSLPEPD